MKFKKQSSAFTLILTAFRATNSLQTNVELNWELRKEAVALGLHYEASGVGSYKEEGQTVASQEISMAFSTNDNFAMRRLVQLACDKYKQDCCLLLNGRDAYLVSVDGYYLKHEPIGRFLEVEEKKPSRPLLTLGLTASITFVSKQL